MLDTELSNFHTKIVEIYIQKKNIGIANEACLSQVLTLFERLPVQKHTLFKTLNSEIVYPKTQDLENHTLFSGTYPYSTNKPEPPRYTPRDERQE